MISRIVEYVLPPRCLSCGAQVLDHGCFCQKCWSRLLPITDPVCKRCGSPQEVAPINEEEACLLCQNRRFSYDQARSAFIYNDVVRTSIMKFKHGDRPEYAALLVRLMQFTAQVFLGDQDTIIIPVPVHRTRLWERGYNQTALLANAFGRQTGFRVLVDALHRRIKTPVQRGSHRQRAENVRGAFVLRASYRDRIERRPVILIDDVLTTGATVDACARALRVGRPSAIYVLTFARVVRTGTILGNQVI